MKSFVLSALVFVSVSAIRTNPVSTIPQAAIDRAYTQKQLIQNNTNTTNDTKVAVIQNATNTTNDTKIAVIQNATNVTNETKVAAIQAKVTANATAASADMKNPLLGNSEPKAKEDTTAEKEPVAWMPDTLPACPSAERTMMDDGKTHVVKYPYVGATCKPAAAILAEVEGKPAAKAAAKPVAKPAAKKDPAPWKDLEHCPDFNERRTLKNGQTEAVAYPKKGYNCNNEGPK